MRFEFNLSSVESIEIHRFGLHAVTNRFLGSRTGSAPSFPLGLSIHAQTGLIHLTSFFPISELRPRYEWLTCYEPEDHLDDLVMRLISLPRINYSSVFAGFSFKDDSTIDRLEKLGFTSSWRICPNSDLGIQDNLSSIETIQHRFSKCSSSKILENHKKADVFLIRHVLEHADDLSKFLESIKSLVSDSGYFVFEVPDCERSLNFGDCTVVWEEHTSYFTENTLRTVLELSGYRIVDNYSVPYPLENSIVVIAQKEEPSDTVITENLDISKELKLGENFSRLFVARRKSVRLALEKYKRRGGVLVAFGAGHLTFTFIGLYGLYDLIDFVIDDDQNKCKLFSPVGGLPIVPSEQLYKLNPSLCLLGVNPMKHSNLMQRHSDYVLAGGRFASIFPGTPFYLEDVLAKD